MRDLSNNGVQFTTLNDTSRRGQVSGYHSKPDPIFRTKATAQDVSGLKSVDRKNISFDGTEYESKFKIGFEVEKARLHRGAVEEYPLFCGFETDSSCGYEAVTHVLPLVAKSMWRTKVFNMFHQAKKIIDDEYSPSDATCGGHMTISAEGMTGAELMSRVRKFTPIILSIFRKRLTNRYCNGNPQFLPMGEGVMSSGSAKYVVCKDTGFGVEFRIPSRITSVKQMIRRYELMYILMDFAVNQPNATMRKFYNAVKPIMLSMYEKDEVKVDKLITLARDFEKFVKTGKVDHTTAGWLEGWWSSRNYSLGKYRNYYKRNFRPDSDDVLQWRSSNRMF
jgi:hypothetical protein